LKLIGVVRGVTILAFFGFHTWIFLLYRGRVKDLQSQIKRLASENKEHRERFTALLDKRLKIPKPAAPKALPRKKRRR